MSEIDSEYNTWKKDTRTSALEKEIERLRQLNRNQSHKIHNLRKIFYFQLFFFIAFLTILFFKGFISLPGKNINQNNYQETIAQLKDSLEKTTSLIRPIEKDTIYLMGTPDSIINSSIIYSIQIGAFEGKDLSMFESNFTKNIRQDRYGAINQISVGLFTKYNHATSFLSIIKDLGFKDAFIMALRDGKKTNLQEIISSLPDNEKTPIKVKQPYINYNKNDSATITSDSL
ncbi:MAG: hypothetical protein JW717_05670 [Marinilabiliaceae bacterium]|nr:hypothetical protein [Marinilabiliaceae bacterium]